MGQSGERGNYSDGGGAKYKRRIKKKYQPWGTNCQIEFLKKQMLTWD